jgi:dephospho-CoA kinase
MVIVGLTGLPGAGKSEAADVSREEGFEVLNMGDVVREEVRRRGLELTNETRTRVSNELREKHGKNAVAALCVQNYKFNTNTVLDGIRSQSEAKYFETHLDRRFYLVGVQAPREVRADRIRSRLRTDGISAAELKNRDEQELAWGVENALQAADYTVENDGTIGEFRDQIRRLLSELNS